MSLKALKEAVIEGDEEAVVELVEQELEKGIEPGESQQRFSRGDGCCWRRFKNNAMFVPEVLMSANVWRRKRNPQTADGWAKERIQRENRYWHREGRPARYR